MGIVVDSIKVSKGTANNGNMIRYAVICVVYNVVGMGTANNGNMIRYAVICVIYNVVGMGTVSQQ